MEALVKQPTTLSDHLMNRASPLAKKVLKTSVGAAIGATILRLVLGLEVFSPRWLLAFLVAWLALNAALMILNVTKEIRNYWSANQG